MLLLHAGFVRDETFTVWGEQSVAATATAPVAIGADADRDAAPAALPFGATATTLRDGCRTLGVTRLRAADETLVAWLPAVDGAPVPSHPALTRPPLGPCTLAPFAIAALTFPDRSGFDFCAKLLELPQTSGNVTLGDDLLVFLHAFRLAASLVVRQRYVPTLRLDRAAARSQWQPLIEGSDATALTALAAALPRVARALAVAGAPHAPPSARSLLGRFLEGALDAIVRDGAGEAVRLGAATPGFSDPARRAASLHDEWVAALADTEPRLRGEPAAVRPLARAVESWSRPLTLGATAPVRVVFRLEAPAAADASRVVATHGTAPWLLRTLLRGVDDPSLLVPLGEALEGDGAAARLLVRPGVDLREHALVALSQAAAVSSLVARGFSRVIRETVELTVEEAHLFLTAHAAALEQAGFLVQLPGWWNRPGARPRLSARASASSPGASGGLTLDSLVAVDWQAALGDTPIALEELRALAQLKAPLVQLRGQWIEADTEQLHAAIRFFEKAKSEPHRVRDLVAMKLGVVGALAVGGDDADLPPLAIAAVGGDGEVGELLARLDPRAPFAERGEPDGFVGTLRPYQRRGWSWLKFLRDWRLGGCLADDMGLGKTIQTLALLQAEHNAGERRPALLVCPTSVVGNWQREAARFTPGLAVLIHHGVERAGAEDFERAAGDHALVLTSYALLHRDLELFARVAWSGVILDEAQNIKNPETKQARAARAVRADWRVALTGTPVENHVGDLWSIMEFLNPGLLGSAEGFRRDFLRPIQLGIDPEVAARLRQRTGPFLLRRLKSDPAIAPELPEKLEHDVICTLTREQASLYAAVVDDAQEKIAAAEGIERRGLILALLTKLKQICNHPTHFLADRSPLPGRSGKLERLVEMLEEVCEEGDRSLVFTQFKEMGDLLEPELRERLGVEVLFLHGGTPRALREQMVANFQREGGGPAIFLLSLRAGGTGLNLTRANHVFHFDRWWNPAVEDQATDRAHRIGQVRQVQVHKLLCAGTLEERIDALIRKKKGIAEQVVGTGDRWLTELTATQLQELVTLGDDAVAD